MSKISILHISDLHKKEAYDFDNLYDSMVDDSVDYAAKGIMKPNVIVVSGDLIRGGTPDEIDAQYKESKEFLEKLTTYFLKGDKRRILIVPGNHDVDWNVSKAVMKSIPKPQFQQDEDNEETKKKYLKEKSEYDRIMTLFRKGDLPYYRWDWDVQELKCIEDKISYKKRFEKFATFYKDFYGIEYSLNPQKQYKLFDFPDEGFCFVGFNSCNLNDHLNYSGKIAPQCVTSASKEMAVLKDRVFIGVWHHNINGIPIVDNYLDYRVLDSLLKMDMRVGLHGHQHYSSVIKRYKNVDKEDNYMYLISTGSLYGTSDILNYGTPRQYNILELERRDNILDIKLHLREDENKEEYDLPSWVEGTVYGVNKQHWHTTMSIHPTMSEDEEISSIISEAMRTEHYHGAISKLIALGDDKPMIRKLIIDFYGNMKDYRSLIYYIGNPQNMDEITKIISAAGELNDKDINEYIRNLGPVKYSTDPSVKQMLNHLR